MRSVVSAIDLLAPIGRLSFSRPEGPTGGWLLALVLPGPSDPRGHGPTLLAALSDLADALVSRNRPEGEALREILAAAVTEETAELDACIKVCREVADGRAVELDARPGALECVRALECRVRRAPGR